MSALTRTQFENLKAGSVFFMAQERREALRCVVQADGDTVDANDSYPGTVSFTLSETLHRMNKYPDEMTNDWAYTTEQDVLDAWDQEDAANAAVFAAKSPAELLQMMYRHWSHDRSSRRELEAVRTVLLNAYGVDVEA